MESIIGDKVQIYHDENIQFIGTVTKCDIIKYFDLNANGEVYTADIWVKNGKKSQGIYGFDKLRPLDRLPKFEIGDSVTTNENYDKPQISGKIKDFKVIRKMVKSELFDKEVINFEINLDNDININWIPEECLSLID